MVAWPSMIFWSSNGGMKVLPDFFAYSIASLFAASKVSPVRTMSMYSLPNIFTCSIFCLGVVVGI